MNTFQSELAKDGTVKITFSKGHNAVIIPTINDKYTVCVSCQVGCAVGCTFCHTPSFKANLTAEQIVEQVRVATNYCTPTAVVFMGQGEPMLNIVQVKKAVKMIHYEFGLSYKKITVSTSGIHAHKLLDLPCNCAISLHSPFNGERKKLIPHSPTVEELVEIANSYSKQNKYGVMIQYTLIKDVNDRDEDLKKLLSYSWAENTNFNLIEYNPKGEFTSSQRLLHFKEHIRNAGYKCFIRHSRGKDIKAACGMLEYGHQNTSQTT